MPAPKGSKNALGNKGGGRPSAAKELANAEFLNKVWSGEFSQEQLKKEIKAGKHGAMHIFALKCMAGNMDALKKLIDKLYANKNQHDMNFNDVTNRPDPNDLEEQERESIFRAFKFLRPSDNVCKKCKTKI